MLACKFKNLISLMVKPKKSSHPNTWLHILTWNKTFLIADQSCHVSIYEIRTVSLVHQNILSRHIFVVRYDRYPLRINGLNCRCWGACKIMFYMLMHFWTNTYAIGLHHHKQAISVVFHIQDFCLCWVFGVFQLWHM